MNTAELIKRARKQLSQLTGLTADTVSAFHHDERGWHISLEMIELARIPHATDVLARYDLLLDEGGELVEYRRRKRYLRGETEDEGEG